MFNKITICFYFQLSFLSIFEKSIFDQNKMGY